MSLIPTGEELRKLRTRRGLTQSELARLAGVSQSLVARLEAGSVDPRVSTLEKILKILTSVPSVRYASDIMTSPVVTVDFEDKVRVAVELMRKRDISQLPVMLRGRAVGAIEEEKILKKLIASITNPERVYDAKVGDLVSSVYPSVPSNASLTEVADLLSRGHSGVLVIDGSELRGIITKIDVITALRTQHEVKI
jgi:predicted transcriptional regulator